MTKDVRMALLARYNAAAHKMQTGVKIEMQHQYDGEAPTSPKHLRVGVNTAHRDHASLVKLLLAKGLFTEEEYGTAIAEGMEVEADEYEKRIQILTGSDKVHLG